MLLPRSRNSDRHSIHQSSVQLKEVKDCVGWLCLKSHLSVCISQNFSPMHEHLIMPTNEQKTENLYWRVCSHMQSALVMIMASITSS